MAVVDVARRAITLKIVYFGCALGGKTTNLVSLHRLTDPRGEQGLVSIATNDDRTLFFDLLPMELGQIGGMTISTKVYTVPGQVHYELTRRQVLGGADGVVLVVDSDPQSEKINTWAAGNLRMNLRENGLDPDTTPIVLQWNKRDLPDALPVAQLERQLNQRALPAFQAVATTGQGVVDTFATVLEKTIGHCWSKMGRAASADLNIRERIDEALRLAKGREGTLGAAARTSFDRRFDMDSYRDQQAQQGRDRRVVDQDSLLSESVQTNMMLAERLDSLREAQNQSERRGGMMEALGRLAPALADPAVDALPRGVMASLLEGAHRGHGSLLLSRPGADELDEREVLPAGPDPLRSCASEGLASLARRLRPVRGHRLIEDLVTEVFFGQPPASCRDLASVLLVPLACDGLELGSLHVYGRVEESGFDGAEIEFWSTAATLIGLSLHWRALRRKVATADPS